MITTRQIEAWAPFGIATAIAITWWCKDANIPDIYSKELLSAMLSAAAICAGFLTTALSILLPIGSTETGKKYTPTDCLNLFKSTYAQQYLAVSYGREFVLSHFSCFHQISP